MLRLVERKKRQYDRAIQALEGIAVTDPSFKEQITTLAKAIRLRAPCSSCDGAGRVRCTFCHGQMAEKTPCVPCKGRGFLDIPNEPNGIRDCEPCKTTGYTKTVICEKCARSFLKCPKCERPRAAPALTELCAMTPCTGCEGRGQIFGRTAWTCPACHGVGLRIVPNLEPLKIPAKPANSNEVDLLQLVHPIRDAARGQWKFEEDALVSPKEGALAVLQINYAPPEEYDLRVVAARKSGDLALDLVLTLADKQFTVVFDCTLKGDLTVIDRVDDKFGGDVPEVSHREKVFKDDKPVTLLIAVRRSQITLSANGAKLLDWKADPRRLSLYGLNALPNKRAMGVGSSKSSFAISEITLIPVKGKGQKLR
jgi:hypothetical protein